MDYYWEHEYGFVKELQTYVKEWISQIDLSSITPICQRLINNKEDLFFNFNYTGVLEKVYKTPHVLHIHGSVVSDWDGDPIIGHCNRAEIQKRRNLSSKAEEYFDEGDASIQDAIADYLETIYKDTAHLININHSINDAHLITRNTRCVNAELRIISFLFFFMLPLPNPGRTVHRRRRYG